MRVKNPRAAAAASPVTDADKADLTAALQTLSSKDAPTFDELRAVLGGKGARFTDGMLHQTALDLGFDVTRDA
jgi:hypothetical protein